MRASTGPTCCRSTWRCPAWTASACCRRSAARARASPWSSSRRSRRRTARARSTRSPRAPSSWSPSPLPVILPDASSPSSTTRLTWPPHRAARPARRAGIRPLRRAPRAPPRTRPVPAACGRWSIACSTGGPQALAALVPTLPADLGCGDRDRPAHAGRLHRLARRAARPRLRAHGARGPPAATSSPPAVALLAPGGHHLRLAGDGTVRLTEEPEIGGLRPRADLTIADAAAVYRRPAAPDRAHRHGQGRPRGRARRASASAAASWSRTSRPAPSTACRAPSRRRTSPTLELPLEDWPPRSSRRRDERPAARRARRLHRVLRPASAA